MKKKLRYLWVFVLIVGIIIGVIGLTKIIGAQNMQVPEMGEDGWFDARTNQTTSTGLGFFLTFFGFVFVGIGGTIIAYTLTRTPEDMAKSAAKIMAEEKRFKDELEKRTHIAKPKDIEQNSKLQKCDYCGATIKNNICPNCGAKK